MHSQSKYLMTAVTGDAFSNTYVKNTKKTWQTFFFLTSIDPLQYRTIRFFYRSENLFCFVLKIGCISTDVQGVYTKYFSIEIY